MPCKRPIRLAIPSPHSLSRLTAQHAGPRGRDDSAHVSPGAEAWPKRVVWKQNDNATHNRFYGSAAPEAVRPNEMYAAHVEGQTITIETPATGSLTLRLSDALLDFDQPVRVVA